MGGLTLGQCQKEKTMAAFHDPKNKTKMKSSQLFAKQKGRTGEYVMVQKAGQTDVTLSFYLSKC